MTEDSVLVQRFKKGDPEAFEMLVKKYQNIAVNIAYSFTRNRMDAEDAAQESFLKIYGSINSFRGDSKFSSWLYRIVVNKAYDLLRKRKHTVQLDEISEISSETKPSEAELMKQLISDCLALIPFQYRSALTLRDMQGLSYEEIAQVLNISVGTVESRIFRGRRMLKEILMKKGVLKDEMQAI